MAAVGARAGAGLLRAAAGGPIRRGPKWRRRERYHKRLAASADDQALMEGNLQCQTRSRGGSWKVRCLLADGSTGCSSVACSVEMRTTAGECGPESGGRLYKFALPVCRLNVAGCGARCVGGDVDALAMGRLNVAFRARAQQLRGKRRLDPRSKKLKAYALQRITYPGVSSCSLASRETGPRRDLPAVTRGGIAEHGPASMQCTGPRVPHAAASAGASKAKRGRTQRNHCIAWICGAAASAQLHHPATATLQSVPLSIFGDPVPQVGQIAHARATLRDASRRWAGAVKLRCPVHQPWVHTLCWVRVGRMVGASLSRKPGRLRNEGSLLSKQAKLSWHAPWQSRNNQNRQPPPRPSTRWDRSHPRGGV
eukprot:365596-Chlamydomonas_euryale.AAC.3